MTSPADTHRTHAPAGVEAGVREVACLDPFLYQSPRWCARCAGFETFVPVDRFPCGWRGYCLGCGEGKYVMDQRTCSEAA